MDKNRIGRPTRCGELAQHSKAVRSSRGGKCGGRAEKQRALTWGDPAGATGQGVSRGHSTEQMSGRAEPIGNALTSQRTPQPTTPEGQAAVRVTATGGMGAYRSRP